MFDFDATLPVMALQFILLVIILNATFYKPLNEVLDKRADYIRQQEIGGKEHLEKARELAAQYEQQLSETRKKSQEVVISAQSEAKKIASEAIVIAQQEAQIKKEAVAKEIAQQRQDALKVLEKQVDVLSHQILEKLLGPELIK